MAPRPLPRLAYKLPSTSTTDASRTRVLRFTPALSSNEYTPVFEAKGEDIMKGVECGEGLTAAHGFASVNAGDVALYVGGGGINKGFGDLLRSCGHRLDAYKAAHLSCRNRTCLIDLKGDCNLSSCYVRALDLKPSAGAQPKPVYDTEGLIFIDMFNKEKRPLNEHNVSMIYVVPPKGTRSEPKASFLTRVRATASSLFKAVCEYNKGADPIPVGLVRVCGFSTGRYLPSHVAKLEVAESILSGILKDNAYDPLEPQFEFAFDLAEGESASSDGMFFQAAKALFPDAEER